MTILRNTALAAGALTLIGVGLLAMTDIGFAQNQKHAMWGGHGTKGGAHRMHRGGGRMGMNGGHHMMQRYDVNKDGQITQEEIDQVQADRFTSGDQDGNGIVTLVEFETLWLQDHRSRMVDRFQALDEDGNGQVTLDEFNERAALLIPVMDRNGDGLLSRDDHPGRDMRGPRRERNEAPRGDN